MGISLLNRIRHIIQSLRRWSKPDNHAPIPNTVLNGVKGAAFDLARSRSELILQNVFLRQQLIVLQRQAQRPELT